MYMQTGYLGQYTHIVCVLAYECHYACKDQAFNTSSVYSSGEHAVYMQCEYNKKKLSVCQFLQLCSSDLSDVLPNWALRVYPWEEGVCMCVWDGGRLGSTAGELNIGRMPDNKPKKMPGRIQDPTWHCCCCCCFFFFFLDGEKRRMWRKGRWFIRSDELTYDLINPLPARWSGA